MSNVSGEYSDSSLRKCKPCDGTGSTRPDGKVVYREDCCTACNGLGFVRRKKAGLVEEGAEMSEVAGRG